MRPTYLQLRSPKERTEYTTDPQISHYGTRLFHDSLLKTEAGEVVKQKKSFCFAPSNRFFYYKWQEKRMPVTLGPGSYNALEQFNKLVQSPCSVKVKPLNTHRKETGQGQTYLTDGGLIMKDPHADKIYGRQLTSRDSEVQQFCSKHPRRSIAGLTSTADSTLDSQRKFSPNENDSRAIQIYARKSTGFQRQQIQTPPQNSHQSQIIQINRPFSNEGERQQRRYAQPKGSFSRRLLQSLKYAEKWGQPVSEPTFKPGYFSPAQSARHPIQPKQQSLIDTSPWPAQSHQQQQASQQMMQMSSLPATSYASKRSEIKKNGFNGVPTKTNTVEKEEAQNFGKETRQIDSIFMDQKEKGYQSQRQREVVEDGDHFSREEDQAVELVVAKRRIMKHSQTGGITTDNNTGGQNTTVVDTNSHGTNSIEITPRDIAIGKQASPVKVISTKKQKSVSNSRHDEELRDSNRLNDEDVYEDYS